MKLKKKFLMLMLSVLVIFAMSATIALAADYDVNAKYYSKSLDSSTKVTAIISPIADVKYGTSYYDDVYLLVTSNGETYGRVYFTEDSAGSESTHASASIELTQSGKYNFTVCKGDDSIEVGKTLTNGQLTFSRFSIDVSGVQALNPFTDVKNNAWYTDYICTAYAMGLVNGMTATTYCPNDHMTIAQAVVLATRMHQLTTTGETVDYSDYKGKWYQPYFDYAISKGFVDKAYLNKWNQKATRAQFADIFANCIPNEYMENIHYYSDGFIPDVKMSDPHGADIYKLYNAGILQGSDDKFSFLPNTNIKRSEIAAIVVRMVVEEERIGYIYDETDEDDFV